jgi:hypothetical protein
MARIVSGVKSAWFSTVVASSGMVSAVILAAGGPASAQEPLAAFRTQGSGIKIVLDEDFIAKYADRVTMATDYIVDQVSPRHPANQDGEVHIAGKAAEARLPVVAELTNPESSSIEVFRNLAARSDPADRSIQLEGVWRLWCEHAGTKNQVQGAPLPDRFPTSNPDHVFEIHPITKFGSTSLLSTFRPIEGYEAKPADRAILAYENAPCHLSKAGSKVTIDTMVVGFNFVAFILSPSDEQPQFEVPDGRFVMCQLHDVDGELVARRRRVAFVKGTEPELKVKSLGSDGRLRVIGIPRINLRLVQWRLEHQNDPQLEHPLDWSLPYEIVAIAVVPGEAPGE